MGVTLVGASRVCNGIFKENAVESGAQRQVRLSWISARRVNCGAGPSSSGRIAMPSSRPRVFIEIAYEEAAQEYLRNLPPEHFMEAVSQATQRKITVESL